MQEPKKNKNKEHCENVNKYINNPPQPSQTSPVAGLGELEGLGQAQLLQLLGGNPSALSGLSSILGAGGARSQGRVVPVSRTANLSSSPSSTTANVTRQSATTTSNASTQAQAPVGQNPLASRPTNQVPRPTGSGTATQGLPGVQLDTLQRIISELTLAQPKGPSLKDIINVDEILNSGLFDSPEIVAKLAEFLPEGPVSAENLKENIRSPQFSQAVSMFNQALRSGQMSAIISSFGLDPSSVGPNATIEDFLRVIQKKAKEDAKEAEKEDTKESKEDEKKNGH